MTEVIHHSYEMHEGTTSLLASIVHGIGYAASLGMGLARTAVEGLPELFDPSTSIIRRHPSDEIPLPATHAHLY